MFTKIAVATTLFTTAVPTIGIINATTVEATQNISTNTVSDSTSDRKITIWKYEIHSASELGGRGDGTELDPSTAPDLTGKKVMQDVRFEIIRVIPKAGKTLTNPLVQVAGTDYDIDPTFTKLTGTTAADGSLTFDVSAGLTDKKAADGIYLITEVPDASGNYTYTDPATGKTGLKINKPMDPFFVWLPQTKRDDTSKLIYDVHVHPKNIVTDTELDKTIEGGKGYSIKAGNPFQWEATTKLPDGLFFIADKDMIITDVLDPATGLTSNKNVAAGEKVYANYFRVTDSLNAALLLDDVEVEVTTDGSTWTKLTHDTDYEVTLNGTKVAAPNKVTNTTAGVAKEVVVNLTNAGMENVTTNKNTHIRVVYKTHVDKDFNGTVNNEYKVDYLIPGQKPVTETSDKPEYFDGGFDINKTTEDKNVKLSGAKFYIAISEQDAKDRKFLASDGKVYQLSTDGVTTTPALPTGVSLLTDTTDNNGHAEFNGLPLEWFTDSNNNGKQEPSIPSEATWDHSDIKKDYWLVETEAPNGYELIKSPVKVTVTLTSHDTLKVDVENKKKTDLPFTGGEGTMMVVAVALSAITIGTISITIDKKRRQA